MYEQLAEAVAASVNVPESGPLSCWVFQPK